MSKYKKKTLKFKKMQKTNGEILCQVVGDEHKHTLRYGGLHSSELTVNGQQHNKYKNTSILESGGQLLS